MSIRRVLFPEWIDRPSRSARSGRSYIEELITNGDPTAFLFAAALEMREGQDGVL
jgi:hypothetical protein